ncbi:hypothetical protein [Bacillus sp. KH172YL63]|uniref:hypothetical protein n=1 Tax=Bacillus sp. KH172YL63 TaxID=2709784 RepID=UPI0013E51CE1|nr:hypothetical protein [Bacillus sp. KH172YL63]BCB04250.1 hypothetical protein KH172YL63_23830 [Bacillus sp. KH172YL63]
MKKSFSISVILILLLVNFGYQPETYAGYMTKQLMYGAVIVFSLFFVIKRALRYKNALKE